MSEYLFSYGTLHQIEVQVSIFGRPLKGSKDFLQGYATIMIEIKDERFLLRGEHTYQKTAMASTNPNDRIEGTALEVSKAELLLADTYEPENYTRIGVELVSGKRAWIYVAEDAVTSSPPSEN